ncbi:hypothetical protein QOZ80_5BG0421180 [Eleusine coracana subsp. coracana]|nr:hypothetical protein QOZ80_5BG0421180 [Eleusine coracana subsp. coracana]
MATFALQGLVDDDQWEAEDLTGRLGIVAHAAFLRAGFVPYGDESSSGQYMKQVDETGPSSPCFSRRYTAPQLARREGAVLELRPRENGDVVLQVYLLTTDGDRGCLSYEEVLDEATLAPLLSCSLADGLELADWVLPLPALPVTSFGSLPDDAKTEILKRLTEGKDLARVECVSSQLRRLVTERDAELWKAMYDSLGLPPEIEICDSEGLGNWKERYMKARSLWAWLFESYDGDGNLTLAERRLLRESDFLQHLREFMLSLLRRREDPTIVVPLHFTGFAYPHDMVHDDPPVPPPEREEATRGKNVGRQHHKVQRNDYQKKLHGAGAIHSPSSRYRWKHR